MKLELLGSHDPRRKEALGLVRRAARSGRLSKKTIERWIEELGKEAVAEAIGQEEEEAAATVADEKKDPKKKKATETPK